MERWVEITGFVKIVGNPLLKKIYKSNISETDRHIKVFMLLIYKKKKEEAYTEISL